MQNGRPYISYAVRLQQLENVFRNKKKKDVFFIHSCLNSCHFSGDYSPTRVYCSILILSDNSYSLPAVSLLQVRTLSLFGYANAMSEPKVCDNGELARKIMIVNNHFL